MASLRQIRGEMLAEKSRIRSLALEAAVLMKMDEDELLERVESCLCNSPSHELEPGRSQTELALLFLCKVLEPYEQVMKELSMLFSLPETYFLAWPSMKASNILERVKAHGCTRCQWQQDVLCLQSEGEDNFPERCPVKIEGQ